jgi:tetratricopeptide (TPR) repeat protein
MGQMTDLRKALEAQREMERQFVAAVRNSEKQPKGWPAALILFHVSMWRERLRNALADVRDGRPYQPPPENIDEFNDAEVASGLGVSLADISERSDTLLASLITLSEQLGERPFKWYIANTTTEALLRNSYIHPRNHIVEYLTENGDQAGAKRLVEEAASEMRDVSAPALALGAALYNLAGVRATQGRLDEAIELLREALPMRPDMKSVAPTDQDLAPLRDDPRFKEIVSS